MSPARRSALLALAAWGGVACAPRPASAPDISALLGRQGEVWAAVMPHRSGFRVAALDARWVLKDTPRRCVWTLQVGAQQARLELPRPGEDAATLEGYRGLCAASERDFPTLPATLQGEVVATVEVYGDVGAPWRGETRLRVAANDLPDDDAAERITLEGGAQLKLLTDGEHLVEVGRYGAEIFVEEAGQPGRVFGQLTWGVLPPGEPVPCRIAGDGAPSCCWPEASRLLGVEYTPLEAPCAAADGRGVCCARSPHYALQLDPEPEQLPQARRLIAPLQRALPSR